MKQNLENPLCNTPAIESLMRICIALMKKEKKKKKLTVISCRQKKCFNHYDNLC